MEVILVYKPTYNWGPHPVLFRQKMLGIPTTEMARRERPLWSFLDGPQGSGGQPVKNVDVTNGHVWLVVEPNPLKNMSALGVLFLIYGKIKFMFQTTNQMWSKNIWDGDLTINQQQKQWCHAWTWGTYRSNMESYQGKHGILKIPWKRGRGEPQMWISNPLKLGACSLGPGSPGSPITDSRISIHRL